MKYFFWAIAAACLAALVTLVPRILNAPLVVNQLLYFAEGRSILNGLHPWQDLFETKPPVIYWISLVSILIGQWFYPLLAMGGLLGMVAVMAFISKDATARAANEDTQSFSATAR